MNYSPYSNVLRKHLQKKSSRCLQDALIKTNIFVLVIRFQDVFKILSSCLQDDSPRRLQDLLQKRLQDIFKTSSKRFQTSSRHPQGVLQRCLQVVFKTYIHVKLFLLTRFQDVFKMYSKCFWDAQTISTEGLPQVTLLRNVWSMYKICKSHKSFSSFSFSLYYTFY